MALAEADEPEVVVEPGDFARDTAVEAVPGREGWYDGAIPEAWRVIYAFGGVSMAVALRALQHEVSRHRGTSDLHLVSANAVFCSPVPCGPVAAEATVLRSGRSAAQGTVNLYAGGSEEVALCATAVFGEHLDVPVHYVDVAFPDGAGRPDDHGPPPTRRADDPFPPINFHDQTDWRPAIGRKWWEDEDWAADGAAGTAGRTPPTAAVDTDRPGSSAFGAWQRLVTPARRGDGTLDPLALCIPADMLGPAVGQKLGPLTEGAPHFFVLTLELGLQVLETTTTEWLFQYCRSPHAGDGYATAWVEIWDDRQRLVALAHQRARMRLFTAGDGFFS